MNLAEIVVVGVLGGIIGLIIAWPLYRFFLIFDKRRIDRGVAKSILEKEQILNIGDKSFRIDKFSANTGKDLRSKKETDLKKQFKDGLKDVEDKNKERLKKQQKESEGKKSIFKRIFKRGSK